MNRWHGAPEPGDVSGTPDTLEQRIQEVLCKRAAVKTFVSTLGEEHFVSVEYISPHFARALEAVEESQGIYKAHVRDRARECDCRVRSKKVRDAFIAALSEDK